MCTTIPPVPCAVTGIEKVVEKLSTFPLLGIRPALRHRAAHHHLFQYDQFAAQSLMKKIFGPDEVHLVLLDNGRSRIYRDQELIATLRCIRWWCLHEPLPGLHPHRSPLTAPPFRSYRLHSGTAEGGLDRYGDRRRQPPRFAAPVVRVCRCVFRFDAVEPLAFRTGAAGPPGDQGSEPARSQEARIWKGWSWMHANPWPRLSSWD